MADISGLQLKKLDPTKWDEYPPGGGVRKRPHNPGTYFAKAPTLGEIKFDTQNGYLRFVNKAKIQDADPNRDEVIFDYVTNKPYATGKRKGASRMGDFLLAVGSEATPSEDHQEWADAVEEGADGIFKFQLDWDAYDADSEKQLADTADDFPDDPQHPGEKLPYVLLDRKTGRLVQPGQETADTKRVAARQRIRFYIFERREN